MVLNEKQKEACVRKWVGISHGMTRDLGRLNCMLCHEYNSDEWDDCYGCPIDGVTKCSCHGTPYYVYLDVMVKNGKCHTDLVTESDEKVLALREALFVYGVIEEVLGWEERV